MLPYLPQPSPEQVKAADRTLLAAYARMSAKASRQTPFRHRAVDVLQSLIRRDLPGNQPMPIATGSNTCTVIGRNPVFFLTISNSSVCCKSLLRTLWLCENFSSCVYRQPLLFVCGRMYSMILSSIMFVGGQYGGRMGVCDDGMGALSKMCLASV